MVSDMPIAAGSLLPKHLASCRWNDNYPSKCELSYAEVFTASVNYINSSNYAARANAYLVAADLNCNTMNKTECSWPCQWDNLHTCRFADLPRLTVWDCPGSPARVYYTCPEAPRLSKAWCSSTPNCTFIPYPAVTQDTKGLRPCEATLYVNMTPAQRLDFGGPSYYVRMPREQIGCCKGSTYRYVRNSLCRPGALSRANCNAIPGCRWGSDGSCLPTPWHLVHLQFIAWPKDPLKALLQASAKRCDAITSPQQCNRFRPVALSSAKVLTYLAQQLDPLNMPISPAKCVVPSGNVPGLL